MEGLTIDIIVKKVMRMMKMLKTMRMMGITNMIKMMKMIKDMVMLGQHSIDHTWMMMMLTTDLRKRRHVCHPYIESNQQNHGQIKDITFICYISA